MAPTEKKSTDKKETKKTSADKKVVKKSRKTKTDVFFEKLAKACIDQTSRPIGLSKKKSTKKE